jgi:hypothetical protein
MVLSEALATTLWSVPLCSLITSRYFRLGRVVSASLCFGLVAYLAYSGYHSLEPNYYEMLGVKHTSSFDEIQTGFRRSVQQDPKWSKSEYEHFYQSVRGNNRHVYAKYGDHIGRTRSVSVDQVVSIGHAFTTACLLASVAAIFLSFQPVEITAAVRVYVLVVFCIDFWVREVDHTFLPLDMIKLLPFEIPNFLVALFPAACSLFIAIAKFLNIKSVDEHKDLAIRRLVVSNEELIRAVQNLAPKEDIEEDDATFHEVTDSGAVLSQVIAVLLLLTNIFLGTD